MLDQCPGIRSELLASERVAGESIQCIGQRLHVVDLDGGVAFEQQLHRIGEIPRVRPDNDGLAESGRLDHVVAAVLDKAAADEDDGGDSIDVREFARRVDQDHVRPVLESLRRLAGVDGRLPNRQKPGVCNQAFHGAGVLRVPRSQDQP